MDILGLKNQSLVVGVDGKINIQHNLGGSRCVFK